LIRASEVVDMPDVKDRIDDRFGEEPQAVLTEDEARGGETGHNVRYVLGYGTAAIVILFLILLSIYIAQ
jgi:hypothetical protein